MIRTNAIRIRPPAPAQRLATLGQRVQRAPATVSLDDATREKLRALGYYAE